MAAMQPSPLMSMMQQPMMSPMMFGSPIGNNNNNDDSEFPTMCKVVNEGAHVRSKAQSNSLSLRRVDAGVSLVAIEADGDYYQIPDGYICKDDVVRLNVPLERFLSPSFMQSSPIKRQDRSEVERLREEISELREQFADLKGSMQRK